MIFILKKTSFRARRTTRSSWSYHSRLYRESYKWRTMTLRQDTREPIKPSTGYSHVFCGLQCARMLLHIPSRATVAENATIRLLQLKLRFCQRPRPFRPSDIVKTDIKRPLPLSPDGYRYILVFQDAFSKYAEMTPIATASAHTVSTKLREWIGRYSIPRTIHSGQGACYTSTTCNELCARYGIRHTVSSAYHPQANGSVERLNRSIETTLAKVVHHSQTNWPDRLSDVQLAYNSAKHDTINASPFCIIFKQGARKGKDSLADHLQSTPQADIQQSQERNGSSSHSQPTDTLQCT